MQKLHTVIVPGVGGSEKRHWQSWLQSQLLYSSRVEQQHWNDPILSRWVKQFVQHIQNIAAPIQIVAHSFGCLTTIAALHQHPELNQKITGILLVAPANPRRFSTTGFAQDSGQDFANQFIAMHLDIPSLLIYSENDPWHDVKSTLHYAKAWGSHCISQGTAGHINVASGFGVWPQVFDYLKQLEYLQKKFQAASKDEIPSMQPKYLAY
ncbi:alpha/beta hydrolase [Acinetobacter qingfengensis]|uniref:Esterase n=1 Tax=Acinetobacter qingfengensis TaxID=1262585 RepID=A0A1E7RF91_9GAMM|nr:alpha/beta hydrolase [Acinetobacter qingfengensis]KAA8735628.1 alpha/beta hydrolase [Acinetobacter qingfengensis]OEY97922.1 esterase [Acinetobacter qingfengensis]